MNDKELWEVAMNAWRVRLGETNKVIWQRVVDAISKELLREDEPDNCGMIPVRSSAIDWLKEHYPALCEKSGLCERIGGRLYTKTLLPVAISTNGCDQKIYQKIADNYNIKPVAWYQETLGGIHICYVQAEPPSDPNGIWHPLFTQPAPKVPAVEF